MRRYLFYIFLSLICVFSAQGRSSFAAEGAELTAQEAQNELEAKEEIARTWDFGPVKKGEVVTHVFTFMNNSERVLNIKGVNTSCGCTVSDTEKKSLKPSEETLIRVNFSSEDYLGPVTQYVYLDTDSEKDPVVRFTVKADVYK